LRKHKHKPGSFVGIPLAEEAIEERLLDGLLGRPNADEERMKVRLR
jgi:hypothetical protein